ncbi:MAG: hypothetical protein LBD48_05995 [Treponema sp.]|nr:hypothetical protein [Treponema sp.]
MESDKEMTEVLRAEFSTLNDTNKKSVIEMTKFLVLTQNMIVSGFLEKKGPSGDGSQ